MQKGSFTSLKVATESASLYDIHLLDFLVTSKNLVPFSPEVYQLNPKITSGFKKVYPDKDKTDNIDVFVITDRLRFGRLPAPYTKHRHKRALALIARKLVRLIFSLLKNNQLYQERIRIN